MLKIWTILQHGGPKHLGLWVTIRITFRTDQMKQQDRGEAENVMNEDRKHAIEAAIVRTMKIRKVMMHNQLVLEVIATAVPPCTALTQPPQQPTAVHFYTMHNQLAPK